MMPKTPEEDARERVAAFLGPPREKKARSKTISDSAWRRIKQIVEKRLESGEWEQATGRDFAALYDVMHVLVYEVAPAELGPSERVHAATMAARMLDKQFAGNAVEMAEFFRWAWMREQEREKWRRANDRSGARIGVRLMFGGVILTDWRVERVRKGPKS